LQDERQAESFRGFLGDASVCNDLPGSQTQRGQHDSRAESHRFWNPVKLGEMLSMRSHLSVSLLAMFGAQ
jgi:hypothetical protein